jgi:ribosomal protein S18 acetylase RimI-like enzyme
VHYRLYRPEDFAALYAIEETCFDPPHRFGRRYMRQLLHQSNGAAWIAEQDGQMAGFAIVEWSEEAGEKIAYIQTIEVAPDRRGQGVGGELLSHIEDSARSAGARWIWLHVDAKNASAIRLYEAYNYLTVGREENYYGRGQAALLYTQSLET